jgi:hypothetical protein
MSNDTMKPLQTEEEKSAAEPPKCKRVASGILGCRGKGCGMTRKMCADGTPTYPAQWIDKCGLTSPPQPASEFEKDTMSSLSIKPNVTLRPKTVEEMTAPPKPFADPNKITREGDCVILDLREKQERLEATTDPQEESWSVYIPWSEYRAEGVTHVRTKEGLYLFGKHGRTDCVEENDGA